MEVEEDHQSSSNTSDLYVIDEAYEFSAPKFFDFIVGETQEEMKKSRALVWDCLHLRFFSPQAIEIMTSEVKDVVSNELKEKPATEIINTELDVQTSSIPEVSTPAPTK